LRLAFFVPACKFSKKKRFCKKICAAFHRGDRGGSFEFLALSFELVKIATADDVGLAMTNWIPAFAGMTVMKWPVK
jgi:hypothetical protein